MSIKDYKNASIQFLKYIKNHPADHDVASELYEECQKILLPPIAAKKPTSNPKQVYGGFREDVWFDVLAFKVRENHPNVNVDEKLDELVPDLLIEFYNSMDKNDLIVRLLYK